ncbi:MAG: hypothetical protein JEZ06_04205 [Anaerolineaceae bacterium]|nr:hypothetical protein [Anaerolineaceae bacterium]
MTDCQHEWKMINVQYGFVCYEKCYQHNEIRTFFSTEENPILGDEYREGSCIWSRIENAQSFRFDMQCTKCDEVEKFDDLMGFMYCTGCLASCDIDILRRKYEEERTWIMVAFGYFPESKTNPLPQYKLDILSNYFNQRRDTTRSRIKILAFNLIEDLSRCKGEFMHDVGMLTPDVPPQDRKTLF